MGLTIFLYNSSTIITLLLKDFNSNYHNDFQSLLYLISSKVSVVMKQKCHNFDTIFFTVCIKSEVVILRTFNATIDKKNDSMMMISTLTFEWRWWMLC